jgi:hypothetical protein
MTMLYRLLLILFCVLASSQAVMCCSCNGLSQPKEQLESATAVFSGRVITIRPIQHSVPGNRNSFSVSGNAVLFHVNRTWKGVISPLIWVSTGNGMGDCGIKFSLGQSYLVYASSTQNSGLYTGACSGTNKFESVEPQISELLELGEGSPLPFMITLMCMLMFIMIPVGTVVYRIRKANQPTLTTDQDIPLETSKSSDH